MYFPTMKLVFSIEMHKRGGWENSHVCLMKRTAPWQIGTLKYFEIKIKKCPNWAKWDQAGPNRTKLDQTEPNGAKRGQTGLNGANRAK